MSWQPSLYFTSILLTCALAGFLAAYAWRQRSVPGSRAYAGLALGECLLALAETLSMLSSTPAQALFWFKVRYLSLAVIPVFWLVFALEYSGRRDWLSKRLLAGMFIVPVITQVLLWSNSLHGLWVKQEVGLHQNGLFWIAETSARLPGIGFLAHSLYALILLLVGIVLLLITAWRMRRLYRGQALLVAGAASTAFVFAINSIFSLIPQTEFNLFTPGIGLGVLLIALAVFRFQFLKRAPAADAGSVAPALEAQSKRSLAVFVLIFVLMAAGTAAVGYLSYQNYERQFRAQVESQLASIAELKVNELENWRAERMGDAQVMRQNPAFAALAERYLGNPSDTQAQAQIQAWLDSLRSSYHYDRIFLLDTGGVERLSVPDTPEPVAAHLVEQASTILRSGQVTFLDFHRDTDGGPIYLSLLVPVFAEQDGSRPLGILVLRIDPNVYLYPFIQQWPVPSASAETLLIRRDGNDALFLNELKFYKNVALNLRISLESKDVPAVKAALGQTGIVEGVDYRGVPVIADVRAVSDSPWFLVARMDITEVYAPLRSRLWQVVIFFGALIAATGAGLVLVWRQQSVRFYRGQIQAAEVLRDSEIRYRRPFEAAKDGILILDAETGVIVDVNPFLIEMLGSSHESICGKALWELGSFKDIAENKANFLELQQEEYIRYEDLPLETADGRRIEVEFVSNIYPVDHHKVIQCNIRDITERKQAEENIRRLNGRFSLAAGAARLGVWDWDIQKNELIWDDRMYELYGVKREDFAGAYEAWLAGLHPDDRTASDELSQQARRGEKEYDTEFRIRWPDGTVRVLKAYGQVARDAEGNPLRMTGINYDITERKRVEESLRENEEQFRVLFEQAAVGMAQVAPDGRYLRVNQRLCDIVGYTPEELLARSFQDITHPDDLENDVAHLHWMLANEIQTYTREKRYIRKDQTIAWVNLSVSVQREPIGAFRYFVAVIEDITDRKRAEAALRESEERYRSLFENMLDGFAYCKMLFDDQDRPVDFRYLAVNSAFERLTGLKNVVGKRVSEVIPGIGELSPELFESYGRVALSGQPERFEFDFKSLAQWLSISVYSTEKGYFVAVFDDITERKRAEEALHQLNAELERRVEERTKELSLANLDLVRAVRLRDEFLANMSHELRTPLNGILGLSEALQEGVYGALTPKQMHSLQTIESSGQRLLALVSDILDFAKVGAGKLDVRMGPVSVKSVCQASLRLVEQAAQKKRLTLTFQLDEQVESLQADKRRLKQILVNLLANAVKFTPEGGAVGLEVVGDVESGEAWFTIWDTGIGIAPEDIKRLFQPFVQLDAGLARRYEGTGLGLALVARLVELHGGRMWVESEPGKGSRFIVAIPWQAVGQETRASGPVDLERADAEPPRPVSPRPAVTILLAEDDPMAFEVVADYLTEKGYRVITASNGAEALERAQREHPALILMDTQMPVMDGLEATHRIRADAELKHIPVIALTGLAMEDDKARCLEAGANDCLTKPVSLKNLMGVIEAQLALPTRLAAPIVAAGRPGEA